MSTFNSRKYSVTLIIQHLIILFDIFVNAFADFLRQNPINLLVLYVYVGAQDICLVVTMTILLVNFFSTYIFQIGLIQLLYTKFRVTLVLCIAYIILSITLHIWDIKMHWSSPIKSYWTQDFHILHSLHRGVAVLYYYFYKRASLRVADPRFYESSTWIQNQFSLS